MFLLKMYLIYKVTPGLNTKQKDSLLWQLMHIFLLLQYITFKWSLSVNYQKCMLQTKHYIAIWKIVSIFPIEKEELFVTVTKWEGYLPGYLVFALFSRKWHHICRQKSHVTANRGNILPYLCTLHRVRLKVGLVRGWMLNILNSWSQKRNFKTEYLKWIWERACLVQQSSCKKPV